MKNDESNDSWNESEYSSKKDKPNKSFIHRLIEGALGGKKEADASVKPVSFRELFRYAERREKILMLMGVTLAVINGMILPALTIISGWTTTLYISTKEPVENVEFLHTSLTYSFMILGTGIITFLVAFLEHLAVTTASERITSRIKIVFITAVLGQDSHFLDATNPGVLSNQLNNNIERIRDGLSDKVAMLCRSVSLFVSTTVIAFIMNWQIALIMVWTGPICVVTTALMPALAASSMSSMLQSSEEANGVAEEAILNLKTVAACNGEKTMIEKYSRILRSAVRPAVRVGAIYGFLEGTFFFFLYVFFVAGIWWGTVAYHDGLIDEPGTVLTCTNLIQYSAFFLGLLGPHMLAVLKARSAAAVVYQTIDQIPEIDSSDTDEGIELKSSEKCTIEFEGVEFSYKSRSTPILRGLSWSVRAGETVALVGQSGCGKSTSIGLITRMQKASNGKIRLNGKPIEQFNVRKLRKMIGIVSQEPSLFHGTIGENIRLGRPLSDEEIETAARTANAHEFIVVLEKGYETVLGRSGVALSGGQKQRIAIARAIVTNPPILLLDEATSALDSKSERIVQAALQRASAGRTTVVIAHRLSTIRDVSRVYVIGEGRVVEEGGFDELRAKTNGLFAAMLQAQDAGARERREPKEDVEERKNLWTTEQEKELIGERFVRQRSIMSSTRSQRPRQMSVPILDHSTHDEKDFPRVDGGLWMLLMKYKRLVARQILASCFRGTELVILVFVSNLIYQSLEEEDYVSLMLTSNGIQFAIGVAMWIAIVLTRVAGAWVSESVLVDMRVNCFSSIMHRPTKYFDRPHSSSAACSVMLSQQVPLISAPVDYRASIVYENAFAAAALVIICFCYSWVNGFICVLVAVIFISAFVVFEKMSQRANDELQTIDTSAELVIEIFENIKTIQMLAVENYFIEKMQTILDRRRKPMLKRTVFRALSHALSQSFSFFSNFLSSGLGSYLIYIGMVSSLDLYTSRKCISSVGWAVMFMAGSFNDLMNSREATKKVFALIDPGWATRREGEEPELNGSVSFKNVSFAYPSRPSHFVANNLTFSLREGESLALVGPSGGGKSTVVALLERFYEPTRGAIELDSHSLSLISPRHLRMNIALVGQEPVLFRGTIRENITMGIEEASIADVIEACRLANAAEFIEQFPLAYDTVVGAKGSSLSGGQKQRIAIARALIRKPKIILLDEATSALDTQSEQVVRRALEATAVGRTSITIAHRLDTITHCGTFSKFFPYIFQ